MNLFDLIYLYKTKKEMVQKKVYATYSWLLDSKNKQKFGT